VFVSLSAFKVAMQVSELCNIKGNYRWFDRTVSDKKESPETDQVRPNETIKPEKIFASFGLETRAGINLHQTISL
jgi:hypothetical protein